MSEVADNSPSGEGPTVPKQAFTNRETHPLVLNLMLLKEFGSEYLGWEPETCWLEIRLSWNTTISEINKNKIQAIRTCHTTDAPYDRWEVFEKVAMGLVGLPPKFDMIQRPTPNRAALALEIMAQVKEVSKLSDEVYKYVAAVMLDHGLAYGPGPLGPCNKHITRFVGAPRQARISKAVKMRRKPTFNGKNEDDVQIMKATSVKDFLESASRTLLTQVRKLLP
jgi:hypothetical protein